MMEQDFSTRKYFPGTASSDFEKLIKLWNKIEMLPAGIFPLALFLLAFVPGILNTAIRRPLWRTMTGGFGLLGFFISDWAMISTLPLARKSFGPAKPPTLILAFLRLIPALLPRPLNWIGQGIGSLLVAYGFWVEPHKLVLARETLRTEKLSAGPPLRILHLGDLHMERITEREEYLLESVRRLNPDLILFSGDFLNLSNLHDPVAWDHAREVLRQLDAPLGVYAVTGSPAVDKPGLVRRLLDGLHIRWLEDEKITLTHLGQSIDLVGIACTHKPFVDGPRLRKVLNGGTRRFTILLYHTPDLAPIAARAGIDLQLSGHTHGGQVRLPGYGAVVTASLYGKRFESGRRQLGTMTLYVTRGIGMEGKGAPRVRFLCPPEIVLWEVSGVSR